MNKIQRLTTSIIFLIVLTTYSVFSIYTSSPDYTLRISIGTLASNISTDNNPKSRTFSDYIASNLTSENIQAGRLSILQYNLPPTTPELHLPSNDSFSNIHSIVFSWYNSTDPNQKIDLEKITYLLEIYNDSALTQIYYRNEIISETSFPTSINISIPEEIALYWRVQASDSGLNSTFSEVRITTVDTIPPTSFNLLSPANTTSTTDNTPSLSWAPANETNLDNYTIELCTSQIYITPNYTQKETSASFSNWTTQLPGDTYFWKVIAYDKANNQNESEEQFILTISALTETITQVVSTGESTTVSGGVKQKPFNIDIISPPSVTVYSKDQVIVPLIITNPANEVILRGINLNASSDSEDISPTLGTTFIQELRPKEQRTVPLTITTHTQPGTYGITITADIINPSFTDSVKIYANLIEKDTASETRSSKQIVFAKELFNGNPVCLELKEYLAQAEIALEKKQYDKALNLADNAIQSCKDLISLKIQPEEKTIETYIKKANRNTIIIILEILAFLIVLAFVFKLIRKKR